VATRDGGQEDWGLADPERPDAARIWSVGGGKGGVGKSVVSSSLATAIAGTGRRCVLIDADLGGANLHTLFGVRRPRRTLSDFLAGDVATLADLMVQTPVKNLFLVSGNQASLEMANPKHSQREMLFRHIRSLEADDVILDLGAGSTFNVLDLFLLARSRLVVVTPEPTSIENAEHFLRAAFYRALRDATRRSDVRAAIERVRDSSCARDVRCARELIERVREIDPPAAKPLEDCAERFRPMLIVNQVRTTEHRRIGPDLARTCRERLGVNIELAGSLDADESVTAAIAKRQPTLQAFPLCRFSHRVEAMARRLLRGEGERTPTAGRAATPERPSPASASQLPVALPPLDLTEPGAYLRRCREAQALTLDEMVERTRIRSLVHIEGERFDRLPPEPYLKSYLIEYARELGVTEIAELANSYLERLHASEHPG
jgi:flagellar biosynthesis protein FlhG